MAGLVNKLAGLPATLVREGAPRLRTFLYYARVELTPPKPSDLPQIKSDFAKLVSSYKRGAWKEVTVKQGFLNLLVTAEVLCWFYIGEVIGKRHLIGYKLY